MLNNNSNIIRNVKRKPFMLHGGKKGRPSLLHNGIAGNKGGANHKGTAAKPGKMLGMDTLGMAVKALKRKK